MINLKNSNQKKQQGVRPPLFLFRKNISPTEFQKCAKCQNQKYMSLNLSSIYRLRNIKRTIIFVLFMNTQIKVEPKDSELSEKQEGQRRKKSGRWSTAECYLFQSLLQKYGKNWKRVQEHMKNRSLGQIRSHAQKYFEKVGPNKVEEFERRAKIIQAYEVLQKEKRLREETIANNASNQKKPNNPVKQEEESPITTENVLNENLISKQLESINLKEQQNGRTGRVQMVSQQNNTVEPYYHYWNNYNTFNGGYLLQIIGQNPEAFSIFPGIQPYVDSSAFSTYVFHSQ